MKRIIMPGHNCWRLDEASDAGLLVDGRDYYRALWRAAQRARRYIAFAGWQFDSDVALLRGEEAQGAPAPVQLLPMLQELCERRPELQVWVLAWDYSPILALERQWMQELVFNWNTSERLLFRFDRSAPLYAAHHQKFVLIDGQLAFAGGMDVCDCRWDERSHPACSPLRQDCGRDAHGPYHDVQAVVRGPAVAPLVELFEARWLYSGGGELKLPEAPARDDVEVEATLPLPAGPVALSRTVGRTLVPRLTEAVREVETLYRDAVDAAERFIYVENQYFSARSLYDALVRRMRQADRPRLDIVFVLPQHPEALREQVVVGVPQARLLRSLERVAAHTGHRLRAYCTQAPGGEAGGGERPVYIHSKVMVVDDRFLTVGSANTTNRSFGLDSELNLSWESCEERPDALQRALRRVRVSLLAEHTGLAAPGFLRALARAEGLVPLLDGVAQAGRGRLRVHPLETVFDRNALLKSLAPRRLPLFDPDNSVLSEELFEAAAREEEGFFAHSVRQLTRWLVGPVERPPSALLPAEAEEEATG